VIRPTSSLPAQGIAEGSSAVAAIAAIASRLARRDALEDRLHDVLHLVRDALRARSVSVWRPGGRDGASDWTRVAGAGDESDTAPDVAARLLAGESDTLLLVRHVIAADRRMGALSASLDAEPTDEARALLGIVADLFAPELLHAERARQLELEIEARTRQNDEQALFTEKIVDSLPVGLYVIDREYRINAWNRKRETGMQGVAREEAIGRTIFEILHRQPAESLRREFDEVFRSGRIQVFHMDSNASGDVRTFRISKIPMRLGDGAVTHVITIGEDVTEWKEAQERFSQAEKLAAIGQLAAGVMHEINNPLATIAACAESLELRMADMQQAGQAPPADSADFLRIIDQEVHRCKRIVDGLLDFSRPRSVVKTATDINQVIEQTIFLVQHHSRFKKLRMTTALDDTLPRVHANQEQLIQVFMALLINALDAMEDTATGSITIHTRRGSSRAEAVVAEVIDEGHGIPGSETSKIFEPFYSTKAPGRGTGLGLSIVYGIVSEHGGRIEVDSRPGSGSTFRILLPADTGGTA
jgi:two-component system NtrC family sensor kinase